MHLPRCIRYITAFAVSALLLLPVFIAPSAGGAQAEVRYFPETGHTLRGVFLQYWLQHGGLAAQGYPLTEEYREGSKLDGKTYTVQYFERAIFELHPDNAAPYTVLLAQLGTFRYRQKYPHGASGQHRNPNAPRDFAQTGHAVGGSFRRYWEQYGGLAQFGYPLTDEFAEQSDLNGQTYTVQYFERAVFEWHPENAPPYDVLLSQLGKYELDARYLPLQNPAMARVTPPVPPATGGAGVAGPALCDTAPGDTYLCLSSAAGDRAGGGRDWLLTDADAAFTGQVADNGIAAAVASDSIWRLGFTAAEGRALSPGIYEGAVADRYLHADRPGLAVFADVSCSHATGRFQILDLDYNAATGALLRLAVNFEQRCDPNGPLLRGSLHLHSTAGRRGPPPTLAPTQTPAPPRTSATCQNAPGDTFLCLDSPTGNYGGQGGPLVLTENDALFAVRYSEALIVDVRSAESWNLAFAAPQGSQLAPGRYDRAGAYPLHSPLRPGMVVRGAGTGCDNGDGRFEILELVYDTATGAVSKLAVNFEQHCVNGGPVVFGTIRIHSNAGRTGPPPPLPPTPMPVAPRTSAACADAPGDTFLCLDSQAGDFIGAGHTTILTVNDALFAATYRDGVAVSVRGTDDWQVEFAPPDGQQLAVGLYDRAERAPFHSPRRPGLEISGAGRGCNELTGRFEILDLDYDRATGEVTRLAANFEQHCEGGAAPLIGTVRIHSNAGRSGPPPPLPPTPTAAPPRPAAVCADEAGAAPYLCMSSEAGDYIGQGHNWVYTAPAAQVTGRLSYNGGIEFFVKQGTVNWNLMFAPPQGQQLAPGRYDRAERAPFHSPLRPGLEISGMGRACNRLTGRFEILEYQYDYATGALQRFRANFEQHCDGNAPALLGTIHFDASATP